jgi:hypothetical protein
LDLREERRGEEELREGRRTLHNEELHNSYRYCVLDIIHFVFI